MVLSSKPIQDDDAGLLKSALPPVVIEASKPIKPEPTKPIVQTIVQPAPTYENPSTANNTTVMDKVVTGVNSAVNSVVETVKDIIKPAVSYMDFSNTASGAAAKATEQPTQAQAQTKDYTPIILGGLGLILAFTLISINNKK